MKTNKFISQFVIISISVLLITGCKKNNAIDNSYGINAISSPDLVNRGLRLPGRLLDGQLPYSTGTGSGGVLIVSNPRAVEVAAGVDVYIPYQTNNNNNISKLFAQVEGADSYWEIPPRINGSNSGPLAMKIFIPNFVQRGNFNIIFSVEDKNGNVSPVTTTNIIVTSALTCNATASGSVGITVKLIDLGIKKGLVSISYDTYTITDRIDVWHTNKWIVSTGNIYTGYFPECTNYSQGSNAGFVSGTGTLAFDYDPKDGQYLAVYITGCDNDTKWDIQVNCPQEDWLHTLPDCPCTYQQMLAKDGTQELGGTWKVCVGSTTIEEYHYGAINEARWAPNTLLWDPGQQCTYDNAGKLITAGIAAGSPDKVSPGSCSLTTSLPGHIYSDVRPWSRIPCWQYLLEWPANTGILCGNPNPVTTIDHSPNMIKLIGDLDCERATLLIKSAKLSITINPVLKTLLTGGQNNSTYAELITMLQNWKTSLNCSSTPSNKLCLSIDSAISNLQ